MPLAARILFGAFGLVVAVYAAASITGNWLSTPPWWTVERERRFGAVGGPGSGLHAGPVNRVNPSSSVGASSGAVGAPRPGLEPREGRELISVGVGAVGLAALAFAAWPRRQPGSA